MPRGSALVAVCLPICAAVALAGQVSTPPRTPPPPAAPGQVPVFRGRTDLVELDVSVLDKNHQPVRGLTAADFIVKEAGKPQNVVVLHEMDMDDAPPPAVAWMRDVTPDVTTNALDPSARMTVILIDDALIPLDAFMVKQTKAIVSRIIDKLGPRDETAIVFSVASGKTQDFTTDHHTLLAALDGFMPGYGVRWAQPEYVAMSLHTLGGVASSLMSIEGRRKAVLWITPGPPVSAAGEGPQRLSITSTALDQDAATEVRDETTSLFERAQRANVAIYPIDPAGLGGLEEYVYQDFLMHEAPSPAVREAAHRTATKSFEYLETAALNTGGHAIVNTNDALPGVDQIFEETGSYYMLGFKPLNTKEDGTLRLIDVRVDRPGVEVHTRSGYYAPKAPDAATRAKNATENAVLGKAIGALLPSADLPLGVTLAPFAVPFQHKAAVAIALGVRQPVPDEAATKKLTETTELQISAFTPDGRPRDSQRSTAHVVLRVGATGEAVYEVLGRIDLAPGQYELRLAAHDTTSKTTGSVAATLVIPDFEDDALSLSGVVVTRTPATPSAPRELLAPLLPVVPTATREFVPADRVETYLQLYQSGKKPFAPARVKITIANDHGGTDLTDTRALPVDAFHAAPAPPRVGSSLAPKPDPFANAALRAADLRYQLPMAKLAPGEHLLTFEATCGATTLRRDVRFSVR